MSSCDGGVVGDCCWWWPAPVSCLESSSQTGLIRTRVLPRRVRRDDDIAVQRLIFKIDAPTTESTSSSNTSTLCLSKSPFVLIASLNAGNWQACGRNFTADILIADVRTRRHGTDGSVRYHGSIGGSGARARVQHVLRGGLTIHGGREAMMHRCSPCSG